MSSTVVESSKSRLEDGEIDESNEPSMLPESMAGSGIVKDLRVMIKKIVRADKTQNDQITSAVFENKKKNEDKRRESSEAYNSEKDQEIVYIDEDEMLCVRGASPVPFVVERLSYSRKSPLQDCDTISFDITPPKRRKTSSKRRRKRTTPRKLVRDKGNSSDEELESGNFNPKDKERSQSPQEPQTKLPQLCKFYLQDCCAKKSRCEYMHSEFPCKFYYMGLKCGDEKSEAGCKLYHGGSLSAEMLSALDRHINTAPVDVLGQEFVDMRSNMQVSEISQMLQNKQDNLTSSSNISEKILPPQNDSSNFFLQLREKLYFLSEDQIKALNELEINKVDDLLNLTLAQLNAIGIHATQIEAIQMSFVAGQDTDMRNFNTSQIIPSFEVVCYNDENTCNQNWYEKEEVPLVIDEANIEGDDGNKGKTPEEDDIIIDVVGDLSNDGFSNTVDEEIAKVEDDVAITSASDKTDNSQHFIIEETQEGIEVLPNSLVIVNNYSKDDFENHQNEQATVQEYEKIPEQISVIEINKTEQEIVKKSDEVEEEENPKKFEELQTTEELSKDKTQSSNTKDQEKLEENTKVTEEIQTSEESPVNTQDPINKEQNQLNTKYAEEHNNIETRKDDENLSSKQEYKEPNISREEAKSSPVLSEPLKEDINAPLHVSIQLPKENNHLCSPKPENVVAEIDLKFVTPPRKSTEVPPAVRLKSEPTREYNNPFHRKIISSINEVKQRYSPIKEQRKVFIPKSNLKTNQQMQADSSSEDWDADERSDIQSPPKEIASPDQSEDESTPFVADGSCPELPLRTRNLDNYQPAMEINAHLTYPPMDYKLHEIYMPQYEVNKPTLMDKLIRANSTDPRLKKFIEKEKNHGIFPQAEYTFFPPNISQCDPRLRPGTGNSCQDQNYNASRVLYSYLQRSQWYQELKSNLKIQINHSVSDLVRALNYFHKDPSPQKIFDLFQIECAGVLLEVMRNVGIFIDVNGNITEEANYNQLCTPLQQQQQQQPPQQPHPIQQPHPPQQSHPTQSPFQISCLGPNTKPGLLGFAPPGVPPPHHNISPMSNENSFARQAFGHDCVCSNNNNDFQPIGPTTFYVGGRYGMNRNQEPGFEPVPYHRQNQKRSFKRR